MPKELGLFYVTLLFEAECGEENAMRIATQAAQMAYGIDGVRNGDVSTISQGWDIQMFGPCNTCGLRYNVAQMVDCVCDNCREVAERSGTSAAPYVRELALMPGIYSPKPPGMNWLEENAPHKRKDLGFLSPKAH